MNKTDYFKTILSVFVFSLFFPILTSSVSISDGDLIIGPDGIKVYIINQYGYKRHIFNPEIFNMYGHLKWSNIKKVDQKTLDSYKISDLYRVAEDHRVFSVTEEGKKRHLNMTPKEFIGSGYSWDQIFIINEKEGNYYVWDSEIKPQEKIKPEEKKEIPSPKPVSQQCSDGTLYGQCSTTKPNQCSDGILKANCQVCGCGSGFYCQSGGNCTGETAEKKAISLVSPANWTDELKKEWNDNIEEVRRVAEGIQQWFKGWNWESLHNEDLPKLIQWGAEHSSIKLVYGGAFESEKVPKVTLPGINAVFEALSAMPSHLIKMLEGGAGGTLHLMNKFENCGSQAGCYLSGVFYITICPSGTGDMHTTAHELGHIVDCVGIRNAKGNDFSFGKTDEGINDFRKEYERIFQPSSSPSSDYVLKEAFAGWFSDYITPGYAQSFRKEAMQDPGIAEKYEFLKTKIFLGKEYEILLTSTPTPIPTLTPISCQNECGQSGIKECSGNGYRICGHYDSDNCFEWGPTSACQTNSVCQNGTCLSLCSDGTVSGQCSKTKGKYCDGTTLKNNCQACGCDSGYTCQSNGQCLACADGTLNNTCSAVKPYFCKDGQLIADCNKCGCVSVAGNQCQTNGECGSKCLPIQYSGDPATKLDIVFVPDNLDSQKVIDFATVFAPIMAGAASADIAPVNYGVKGDFGILKREPFASSKEKINIWVLAVSESFKCDTPWCHAEPSPNWTEEQRQGHEKLMIALNTCPGRDQVVIVPSVSKSAHSGDSVVGSGYVYVKYLPQTPSYMAAITVHEFGHSFGQLTDEYHIMPGWAVEPGFPLNASCDVAGCPKWCSGTPKMSYSEYAPECTGLATKETCEAGSGCVWLPKILPYNLVYPEGVSPYYTTSCIAIRKDIDNGLNCLPNSGCFQGCGGGFSNWWRSASNSIMSTDMYSIFSGWHVKLLQDKLAEYH